MGERSISFLDTECTDASMRGRDVMVGVLRESRTCDQNRFPLGVFRLSLRFLCVLLLTQRKRRPTSLRFVCIVDFNGHQGDFAAPISFLIPKEEKMMCAQWQCRRRFYYHHGTAFLFYVIVKQWITGQYSTMTRGTCIILCAAAGADSAEVQILKMKLYVSTLIIYSISN